jgi:hypothetical protein
MHLIFGKPVAFLAFDNFINWKKDQEFLNFLMLKIQQRLHDPFNTRIHFALIELPYFPEIRKYLQLQQTELGVHFFITSFG